ncbi:MAG: DUF2845 domain-containing protein [Deltaproteobacteria bacterium]
MVSPRTMAASLALALVATGVPGPGRADDGMSCPGGVVSVGDSRLDVLGKCGPATLVESRPKQVNEWQADRYQAVGRTVTATLETWTYDRGSSRLLQYVKIEAGKVVDVRTGGYGRAAQPAAGGNVRGAIPRAACDPASLRTGATTYDLLSLCGEPVFRDLVEEQVAVAEGDGWVAQGATTTRVREIWTYDFGPRVLVRHVLVRDGRVTVVKTGGYGYSE